MQSPTNNSPATCQMAKHIEHIINDEQSGFMSTNSVKFIDEIKTIFRNILKSTIPLSTQENMQAGFI